MINHKLARLLVVDDEVELMTALCDLLTAQGYEARGFSSAKEALRELKKESFDLLLTDLMMPEMDGISLLRNALQTDPYLECIIMTGQGTIETAVEAMKVGAFDYVLKPFKLNTLQPILSRAIERHRLRIENIQMKEAMAIYELSQSIAASLDYSIVINKITDIAMKQLDGDEASLMLPSNGGVELIIAVVRGEKREHLLGEHILAELGIAGWVASHHEPVLLNGKVSDLGFKPIKRRSDIQSSVSLPLLAGGNLFGVLNVNTTTQLRPITPGQMKAMSILTNTAAAALERAQLYKQLKESETNYRSIFENSLEGIYQRTTDGEFLTANPAFARILGYASPEELVSTINTGDQLYIDKEKFKEINRKLQKRKEIIALESQVYRKDGSVIWISENIRGSWNSEDKIQWYESIAEDITMRKQMEKELLVSHTFLQVTNSHTELDPLFKEYLKELKKFTSCEALGIIILDEKGSIQHQKLAGSKKGAASFRAILSCESNMDICSCVLNGITDPKLPFYTMGGSFYVNSSGSYISAVPDLKDSGYESVVMTPIRVGKTNLGLVAMADPHENMVPLETVRILENIALQLAIAVKRIQSRELLKKLSQAIEQSTSTVMITDRECIIEYANPKFTQITGYSNEEVIGRKVTDFGDQSLQGLKAMKKNLEAGEEWQGEFRNKKKNGEYYWESAFISSVTNEKGMITHFIKVAEDITIRKLAAEGLTQQLHWMKVLTNISHAIAERNDMDSLLQVVLRHLQDSFAFNFGGIGLQSETSKAFFLAALSSKGRALAYKLGYKENAILPLNQSGLLDEMKINQVNILKLSTIDTSSLSEENQYLLKSMKQSKLKFLVVIPLAIKNKKIGLLFLFFKKDVSFSKYESSFLKGVSESISLAVKNRQLYADLEKSYTELRNTQNALMEQERLRAMGQMASGIAHDINNTLAPITLYTEALLDNEADLSDRTKRFLTTIKEAASDIESTTLRLRKFYRKQDDDDSFKELLDIKKIMNQVIELTRPRWQAMEQRKGISIDIRSGIEDDLPLLTGMESEIREALINLIFNAVDAMPRNGKISLSARKERDHIVLEVTDTGTGMSEEQKQRCLEPFYSSKGEQGSGLGLAMVYGVMQRHKGDIEIESKPESGTTVRLIFPHSDIAKKDEDQIDTDSAIAPLRLLCIDDDPTVRESLKEILEMDGHNVKPAEDGKDGIKFFLEEMDKGGSFDVVITDLGMPHMDGWQVAEKIKSASSKTPVILLSGWGNLMNVKEEKSEYVDEVLGKPPKLNELRRTLGQIAKQQYEKE